MISAVAMPAPPSPVTFESQRSGRVLLKLGVWTVGSVEPFPHGGRHKAHWRVLLPGLDGAPRPAPSVDDAKTAAEGRVLQWIEGAQLEPQRRPDLCICRGAPA
jgi:hypothetical protein